MVWYGMGRPGEDSAGITEGEMQGGGDEADRPLLREEYPHHRGICVGKSTIGRRMAEILDCAFYDLDVELEHHFHMPISRLKALSLTGYSFRQKASRVLGRILHENCDRNLIVALPPSGLRGLVLEGYQEAWSDRDRLVRYPGKHLARIVFYDDDYRIEKRWTNGKGPSTCERSGKTSPISEDSTGRRTIMSRYQVPAWLRVRKRSKQPLRTIVGNDNRGADGNPGKTGKACSLVEE